MLAVEKRLTSPLLEPSSVEKVRPNCESDCCYTIGIECHESQFHIILAACEFHKSPLWKKRRLDSKGETFAFFPGSWVFMSHK